ncbi:MAG: ribonuclease R [Pseudomonadota bacterium]
MPSKRWRLSADPEAAGDDRYAFPIPSRRWMHNYLSTRGAPAAAEQLAMELRLEQPDQIDGLRRRLFAMERDGELLCNRAGEFGLIEKMDLIRGVVLSHRDGYGFLQPDDGGDDVFMSPRTMRSLLHGDRVLVRLASNRNTRPEAKLVEVLERNTTEIVGRFFSERGAAFVYPDRRDLHQDVLIAPGKDLEAADGQMVVARLLEQPSTRSRPVGEVVQILGDEMAPGLEIDVAVRSHGIPHEWPAAMLAETQGLQQHVCEDAIEGRVDLRALPLVTIDGADAKDFDDAVHCKATPRGWRLWVAIADVSSYVRPGTALDEEARARGNSTYFPGRVVPMLPEALSNGLCSLNPSVDRLAMVCEMLVNLDGEVYRSRFYEAVIQSHARLTYDDVAAIVAERDPDYRTAWHTLTPHIDALHALYGAFAKARGRRGCIEFETTETQIVFGAERKIERIVPVRRNDAHRIIEECMIAANVCAARFLERRKASGMYRVHERPKPDKLLELRDYLQPLGLRLGGGAAPEAHHFASLSKRIDGRADAPALRSMLLRSLPQARYDARALGHFGLALEHYAHFTSPIRRYPDLVVHRAIKHALKVPGAAVWQPVPEGLAELAAGCSRTERRSDDATRDVVAWLKCEYMLDKLGERFDGTVTAVTTFGLFVELDGMHVEGLVHVSSLGSDYFHYDPVERSLRGQRTKQRFGLGDRMYVQVARVDLDERKIDFALVESDFQPRRRRGARRRHSGR